MNWGELRFLPAEHPDEFVHKTGFTVVNRFDYWGRIPVTTDSPELITVVKRS